ncbi:MAG: alpha/beta hydrolase fold domain-containing protein [Myxococcota bacterium]
MHRTLPLSQLVFALLLACGEGAGPDTTPDAGVALLDLGVGDAGAPSRDLGAGVAELTLGFGDSPVPVPEGTRFAPDVAYDAFDDTTFDVFLPEVAGPTPLVVFIHGGGFTGGDKGAVYRSAPNDVRQALGSGAAFATINYRTLDPVDANGVLKPLGDSRRALQFLRYHHRALNVDPARVVAYGTSAGAGTALWLGSHPDMADPAAADPIARESTRLRAVGILGSQSTYDILDWPGVVFEEYGITADGMAAITGEQRLFSFYGVTSWEEMASEAVTAYRAEVDMLELLDAGDAPVWIESSGRAVAPEDTGVLYHHPNHGDTVRQRCEAVGLEAVAHIPALDIEGDEAMLPFFARMLRD